MVIRKYYSNTTTQYFGCTFLDWRDMKMEEKECPKCNYSQIEKGVIRSGNAVVHIFPYNNPEVNHHQ
ncbi:hypothetical protein [Psychrobacillus lasiicapitis]|uniref:hypothetical protein n=1 Tax=Psychrobacillus lasiicapitis TaxID=1636719 RepID=UPI0019C326D3|nr:hypothetical protein [Psychrobacillus lasiicapitis]GGA29765.1 hypothetical protein GCM10011384_19120 [Psychrobacillus lasiicapitis]